jgi:hypothetical protein
VPTDDGGGSHVRRFGSNSDGEQLMALYGLPDQVWQSSIRRTAAASAALVGSKSKLASAGNLATSKKSNSFSDSALSMHLQHSVTIPEAASVSIVISDSTFLRALARQVERVTSSIPVDEPVAFRSDAASASRR